MTRIFISHSHSDSEIASLLVDFLLAALEIKPGDIRCSSVPGHYLPTGTSIAEQLREDLNQTVVLMGLITQDSLRSTWVLFELGSSWATRKLIIPVVGPGLSYKDLPGPLAQFLGVQIDDENPSYGMTDVINQLSDTLGVGQQMNPRREAKFNQFLNQFRAWQPQHPQLDVSQQEEIEQLKQRNQKLEQAFQQQEAEIAAKEQEEALEQEHRQKKQEIEQSLESTIRQLDQGEKELETNLESIETKLAEKEAENAQLIEIIARLQTQEQAITRSITPDLENGLKIFNFEILIVNSQGKVTQKEAKQAQYFTDSLGSNIGLDMIIPGGEFWMGTEDEEVERLIKKFGSNRYNCEKPKHLVAIEPFCMGKYPVTQAEWRAVAALPQIERELKTDLSHFKGNNRPVEQVSWKDAVEFCARLSQLTNREYRLPSEAEWEYACRAGTTTPFYFGETITSKLANYCANSTYAEEAKGEYRKATTPVGQFPPNAYGLYDMHGNVLEWCADSWHENYEGAPTDERA